MTENGNGRRQVELDPPNGGWGYVICLGVAATFVICTAHQPTIGMIYNDFLIEIGEGTSGITLVMGAFGMSAAFAGSMTNVMLKKFSLRQVGLFGGTVYFIGTLLGVFVKSISHMIVANGILQGMGFGVMVPVVYTNFNSYFTENRVLLLSMCKACIGLMTMVYPFILTYTMDIYGFRGTLLVICGITVHIFIAMIVMQPVRWHMKRTEVKPRKDSVRVIVTSESNPRLKELNDLVNGEQPEAINQSNAGSIQDDEEASDPLLNNKAKDKISTDENNFHINSRSTTPIGSNKGRSNSVTLTVTVPERPRRRSFNISPDDEENMAYIDLINRAASMSSLSNMSNIPMETIPERHQGKKKWEIVVDYLDLTLFKDPIYCNIVVGTGLAFFTDLTFFVLQPLYLYHIGFTNSEVATVISVGATTDLVARVILGIVGRLVHLTGRQILLTGAITCTLFRTVFLFFTDFWGVIILTGINGFFRCCVQVPLALVIAEHVPIQRFPSAYGLFMFICGFINIILGPGVGILRDLSDSYIVAFLALNFFNLCCVIPWIFEIVYIRRKQSRDPKTVL